MSSRGTVSQCSGLRPHLQLDRIDQALWIVHQFVEVARPLSTRYGNSMRVMRDLPDMGMLGGRRKTEDEQGVPCRRHEWKLCDHGVESGH